MERRLSLLMLAILLLVAPIVSAVPAVNDRSAEEDDLRETVVRYQIANWDLRADVYFVEIQSKNPSPSFLRRFKDLNKPVMPKSASKEKRDVAGSHVFHVEERHTKKFGVVFEQGGIRWVDASTAEVEGGYVCATLCSADGIYRLTRKDGHWKVIRFDVRFQS